MIHHQTQPHPAKIVMSVQYNLNTLQTSQNFLIQKMLQKTLKICQHFLILEMEEKYEICLKNFSSKKILKKAQVSLAFFDVVNCNNECKPVKPEPSKNHEKTCAFLKKILT